MGAAASTETEHSHRPTDYPGLHARYFDIYLLSVFLGILVAAEARPRCPQVPK
jgi:hypothetical protein